jgi:hypothetical protein
VVNTDDNKPAIGIALDFIIEPVLMYAGYILTAASIVGEYRFYYEEIDILSISTASLALVLGLLYEIRDQPYNSRNFIIVASSFIVMLVLSIIYVMKVDKLLSDLGDDSYRFFGYYVNFSIFNIAVVVLVKFIDAKYLRRHHMKVEPR